jgi:thiol:disulfide interchange protein
VAIALVSGACASGTSPSAIGSTTARSAAATTVPISVATTASTIPRSLSTYDSSTDPSTGIREAVALAATDHKNVLIDFGADWCPDCQVLATLYESPQVRPTLDSDYHLVAVDVGQFDKNLA